ncbi:MAG: hypothetical protein CL424_11180 [Acidimicrobiaceae bacterium]|nr:hypothetical protein [Acidimicrobiaceae bacterium]
MVIDENVQELIYSEVNSYGASLNVRWGTDADGVRVSMQADNEMSEDGYEGHLLVTAGGEIAAWMRAGIEYEDGEYKRDGVVWLQEDEGKRGCVSARRAQHMKVAPKEIRTSNSPTADGGGRVRFE